MVVETYLDYCSRVADFHLNYSGPSRDLRECCWWSLSTEIVLGFPVSKLAAVELIYMMVLGLDPGLFVLMGP